MSYFKDTNNKVHYLDNDNFVNMLPVNAIKITIEEAEAIRLSQIPLPTQAELDAIAKRLAEEQQKAIAKADNVIQYLVNHTPDECASYVAANVTNLATAVNLLQKMAMALSVLCKKEFQ